MGPTGVWSGLINFIVGLISAAGIATVITAVEQVLPADTLDLYGDFVGWHGDPDKHCRGDFEHIPGDTRRTIGGAILQTKPQASSTSEAVLPSPQGEPAEQIAEETKVDTVEHEEPPEQIAEESPIEGGKTGGSASRSELITKLIKEISGKQPEPDQVALVLVLL